MHADKIAHRVKLPRLALVLPPWPRWDCRLRRHRGDPRKEIGANPTLPALQQYFVPPIEIAKVTAWGKQTLMWRRIAGPCTGHRLRASAIALRASQWRRSGGREQRPEGADLPAEGHRHQLGDMVRRRQGQGR